jgi:hypothetical protein
MGQVKVFDPTKYPKREGARLTYSRFGTAKPRMLRKLYPELTQQLTERTKLTTTFANTLDNALKGVAKRVMQPVPLVDINSKVYKLCKTSIKISARRLSKYAKYLTIEEFQESVMKRYSGKKRYKYLKAAENLKKRNLVKSDSDLKFFVKDEKQDNVDKDPRIITYRSDEYCAEGQRFVHTLEHAVYTSKRLWNDRDSDFECAKGMKPSDRIDVIRRALSSFNNPIIVGLDGSRWDAHITLEALKLEHLFYKEAYRYSNQPVHIRHKLNQLLQWQLNNVARGRFRDGRIKFKTTAGRMSGDFNTALGNVILMSSYVTSVMKILGVRKYKSFNDGDDNLIIIEQEEMEKLKDGKLEREFLNLGQEIKIETLCTAREPENIKFCSHRIVVDGEKWNFVRNPYDVIMSYTISNRWFENLEKMKFYYGNVAYADSHLYKNMPIVSELYYQLAKRYSGHVVEGFNEQLGIWRFDGLSSFKEPLLEPRVTIESRISMHKAYGIDPVTQEIIEEKIRKIDFEFLEISLTLSKLGFRAQT